MNNIIVYRSRAEAEIDRMLWDNPDSAAIFGYVMLIALATLFAYRYLDKMIPYRSKWRKVIWPCAIVDGVIIGVLVGKFLGWLLLVI